MSVLGIVIAFGALVAFVNALVAGINLGRYRRAAALSDDGAERCVAVCVPARDEAANIEASVAAALASIGGGDRALVLVHDDGSPAGAGEIVEKLAAGDDRIVLVRSASLPEGWNGKQHGCWRLAGEALERGATHLLFTDADVRLEEGGASRAARAFDSINETRAEAGLAELGLLSAFPRQLTGSLGEALQVPMMFFILLSYLPMGRMRQTLDPAASAACGQFILMSAASYRATGGHELVKASMHEGVMLPREVRRGGYGTDLVDGTDLARVRMYTGFVESWRGFAKNAYEGLGSIGLLVFVTVLNVVGHVLPVGVVAWGLATGSLNVWWVWVALAAVVLGISSRVWMALRLQPRVAGAVLHPIGVVLMIAVQWYSLWLDKRGKRSWRGRVAPGAVA